MGMVELEASKELVEMQAMVEREHEEGCALTEMKRREISGVAFTYLLAALDTPHIPSNSTLLDRLIQDNEMMHVEDYEKDSIVLHSGQVIPGVMLLMKGRIRINQKTFNSGTILHLLSMFVTQRMESEVVAVEASIVAWLPSEHCDLLLDRMPVILDVIVKDGSASKRHTITIRSTLWLA